MQVKSKKIKQPIKYKTKINFNYSVTRTGWGNY